MKTWFGKFVARRVCATGKGKKSACNKLFIQKASLYASVSRFNFLEADTEDHPNKMSFTGTLVILDEPSDKPPHGSQGHRILVPKQVAQENLKSLVGQGLNYSPELDEHAPRRKVGVISDAWIDSNKVKVKGWVWKKDFPEAERDLKQGKLGMSMELANVYVRDENADVWYLEDFVFTGATVLHRDAAAYTKTQLAAAAATSGKGEKMAEKKVKKVAAASGEGNGDQARLLATALGAALEKHFTPLTTAINKLTGDMGEVKELMTVQAAANQTDEDDEELEIQARGKHEEEDMEAGKHEEEEDMDAARHEEDDEEAAAVSAAKKSKSEDDEADDSEDDDDEDDLDAALEDLEEKPAFRDPGEVNKGMEKKGSKTTVTKVGAAGKPFPNLVKASRGMSASAALIVREVMAKRDRKWKATVQEIQAQADRRVNKLKGKLDAMQAQVEKFAELESRRSALPVELVNLGAKSNIDLQAMRADGQKLSVETVDQMLAGMGVELGPTERATMKNRMLEAGLMDEGRIDRYNRPN